jgi:hypothetical protein
MADSSLIRVPTRNHSRAVQGSISAMWWAGVSESTAFHSLESANRYRMSGGVCGGRSVLDAGCWEHGPVRGASSRDDCGERSGPSSPSTRWDSIPRAEPPRTKRLRERVRWCLGERSLPMRIPARGPARRLWPQPDRTLCEAVTTKQTRGACGLHRSIQSRSGSVACHSLGPGRRLD